MSKCLGNGMPLGAVVTTPEIAQVLDTAIFFNTFGGNPFVTAVGSAVLDVRFISAYTFPIANSSYAIYRT